MSALTVGDRVWVPHDEFSWLSGTIRSMDANGLEVDTSEAGKVKIDKTGMKKLEACGGHIDQDIQNLVDLDEMSEGAILHHVRKRYLHKKIYTFVGTILVAANPFEFLPIYDEKTIKLHLAVTDPAFAVPHVFATGAAAYRQMRNNSRNQAVLISGESGAGKTETTKKVLAFLAAVASGEKASNEPGIEDKILESNPLLESLGNAKTLRNNNSSRFGKWMRVDFNKEAKIIGCAIVNYLLEKSRVVTQGKMERNYHIFYFLLKGANKDMKNDFLLGEPEDYSYLTSSGCMVIDGVDDNKEFQDVHSAMGTLGFTDETKDNLYKCVAAILHLGNIQFDKDGDYCKISASSNTQMVVISKLLGVPLESLKYCLTTYLKKVGKTEEFDVRFSVGQANDLRDTLAKAIYAHLFDWTIVQVNHKLEGTAVPENSIGILDIFGFEVFEVNSFEQLCINYSNEKLQLHFNTVVFDSEMGMYAAEEVPTDKVDYKDNSGCVKLIDGKPFSLLLLLEEVCSLGESASDESYANKIAKTFTSGKDANEYYAKHKTKPEFFSVMHFAGQVEYCTTNFLDKNRDTLSQSAKDAMKASTNNMIVDLFTEEEGASTKKIGLGGQFRNQLIGLVEGLKPQEAHFVRCVKPNMAKKPAIFESPLTLRQLRYAGLFEAISIRKSGYAYRANHDSFASFYSPLVDDLKKQIDNGQKTHKEASIIILEQATANKLFDRGLWQVGKTKVFMKTNDMNVLLDRQRGVKCSKFAVKIQALARGACYRIKFCADAAQKKAERKAKKEAEEKARIEALGAAARLSMSTLLVQKHARGFLVRKAMGSVKLLLDLRLALAKKNIPKVTQLIAKIDKGSLPPKNLMPKFAKELKLAKTITEVVRIQDKLLTDLAAAKGKMDISALQRLLLQAETLEMSDHKDVEAVRADLKNVTIKRKVMTDMVAFLKNENLHFDTISNTLKQAQDMGVEAFFVEKVQKVYDTVAPKIVIRDSLRRAIETVHHSEIVKILTNVIEIAKNDDPSFAETEVRCGKALLKLLDLENEMVQKVEDSKFESDIKPNEPRLTDEMINISDQLASCDDSEMRHDLECKLRNLCLRDSHFDVVVCGLKWSKVFCVWKYPEIRNSVKNNRALNDSADSMNFTLDSVMGGDDESEDLPVEDQPFFGFNFEAARSSVYLARTLHKEFDPYTGEAPAELQAAAGAMKIPVEIQRTMNQMNEKADLIQQAIKKPPSPNKGLGNPKSRFASQSRKDFLVNTPIKKYGEYAGISKNVRKELELSRNKLEKMQKVSNRTSLLMMPEKERKKLESGGSWK